MQIWRLPAWSIAHLAVEFVTVSVPMTYQAGMAAPARAGWGLLECDRYSGLLETLLGEVAEGMSP